MILELSDEKILTALLALRRGADARSVRRDEDRVACAELHDELKQALESAAGLRELAAPAPEATAGDRMHDIPVQDPEPEPEPEPLPPPPVAPLIARTPGRRSWLGELLLG